MRDASPERHILASAKGGGMLAGGQFFEMASRFVIAFLLARAIGASGYGLYNLALSAGALFAGLSALGLDDAMVRYVAIQTRRCDEAGVWGTLQIGLGVSLAASLVMSATLFMAAEPLASGLFNESRLVPLLRVFAVIVPFMTVSNVLAAVARGLKRMDYAALAENIVMSVVRVVLLGALMLVGLDVLVAALVFGIADVAATVTLLVCINREVPLRGVFSAGARREYRAVFRFAIPLWISGVLLQFRKNLEILLLGALSVASSVGLFAIVGRVNLLGHVVYRAVVTSVKPVLAELHSEGDRHELARVYRASTRWTFMFTLPFILLMVLFPGPILSMFGQAFAAGATALIVLALAELANAGTGTCGSIIDTTGHTRVKLLNSLAWLAILFGTSMLLIPRWGVLGAAVASLVSTAAINAARVLEVWYFERIQPYDRSFLKPATAGLSAYGLGTALNMAGSPNPGPVRTVATAVLVLGAYGGVSLGLGLAAEDRMVIERVLRRLGARLGRPQPAPTLTAATSPELGRSGEHG